MRKPLKNLLLFCCVTFFNYSAAASDAACLTEVPAVRDEVLNLYGERQYLSALAAIDRLLLCKESMDKETVNLVTKVYLSTGRYRRAQTFLEYLDLNQISIEPALRTEVVAAVTELSASDKKAYEFALAEETIFALAAYTRFWPEGTYHSEADQKSFEIATKRNIEAVYIRYASEWPSGRFVKEANANAEQLAFKRALKKATVTGWRQFLADYSGGKNSGVAQSRLEALAFQQARKQGSVEAIEAFIRDFSNSSYIAAAKQLLMAARKSEPLRKLTGPTSIVERGNFFFTQPNTGGGKTAVQQVKIPHKLEVMTTEVTFSMWQLCVHASGCNIYEPDDQGWGKGNRPVVNVSYYDTVSYITWLNNAYSTAGGKGEWRLPSEAEWYYLLSGKNIGRPEMLQNMNILSGECEDCDQQNDDQATFPVGRLKPNSWGLYDMAGNANEWTRDCWQEQLNFNIPSATTDTCEYGVVRGSSLPTSAQRLALRFRQKILRSERSHRVGFRLVKPLAPTTGNIRK